MSALCQPNAPWMMNSAMSTNTADPRIGIHSADRPTIVRLRKLASGHCAIAGRHEVASPFALVTVCDDVAVHERGWSVRFSFQRKAEQRIVVLAHHEPQC